jgi:shikimate kinase
MGSGKSTVGRRVAELGGTHFCDLDERIAAATGCSIAELFTSRGEAAFRALEAASLGELLDARRREPDCLVVALGGGTLLDETLRVRALRETYVVTLEADEATILARTTPSDRPLLKTADPPGAIRRLLGEREGLYRLAHARLATATRAIDEVAMELLFSWKPRPLGS